MRWRNDASFVTPLTKIFIRNDYFPILKVKIDIEFELDEDKCPVVPGHVEIERGALKTKYFVFSLKNAQKRLPTSSWI